MSSNNMFHVLPKDAYAQYISGEAIIVDVRESDCREVSPKLRQLVNIPMSELQQKLTSLPANKSVYVLSEHGRSAAQAVALLRQNGIKVAKNIFEGVEGWVQYGLPTDGERVQAT